MPIDLSALGQIGSAAAGSVPLAQARWAAAQQAQQEAEQQRRELLAQQIFGSVGPDMPDLTQLPGGQPPQAPAPGQSSQPMQQPTSMNQVFGPSAGAPPPGGPAVAAGSPPAAFPGAAPPSPPVGGGATGGPQGQPQPQGGGQPGLGALMQYLRNLPQNRGADPASIGIAAQRMWALMSPIQQQKLALQEQSAQNRFYAQMYGIDQRARTAQDQIVSREQIAAMNDQTRKWLKSAGGGAGAKETPGERAQHAYLAGQIANKQREINATYLQNAQDPRLPQMYKDLQALGDQLNQFNAGVASRLGGGGAPAAGGGTGARGPNDPPLGTVDGGFRLKAYPAGDPNNWEKVQ